MATRANRPRARVTAERAQTYYGPNPYSRDPVVVVRLHVNDLAVAKGSERCAQIAERSRVWFRPPASFESCGTALGIAEFLAAWTRTGLTRQRGVIHAAKGFAEDGAVGVALGFHNPDLSYAAVSFAVELFNRAGRPLDPEDAKQLEQMWVACAKHHPDYQIAFLMEAARAADVPFMPVLPQFKTWLFGWGARGRLFLESQSGRDTAIGERLSRDKPAGKAFLRGLGVRVPDHYLTESDADLAEAEQRIGWPCIVKPVNGGRSVGVVTDIADSGQLAKAVRETVAEHGAPVMIERQVPGEVYRILVAGGRVACVVRRAAPHVVGDGHSTVRQLIVARNREQAGLRRKLNFVGVIPNDGEFRAALAREGIGLDDVLDKGRKLILRRIPLLSSGAVYSDVTAETHPETLRMAETIAAAFGIENCGIDFITTDIARSMAEEGAVLEANTMPGLRVPMIAGLDMLAIGRQALGEHPARVPAALLVAPRETLAKLRASQSFDDTTGWAIDGAAGVGTLVLPTQAQSANLGSQLPTHQATAMIVRNPFVERIFIAATLDELIQDGLPLDRFDTIACLGEKPDAAWERVLRAASRTYVTAKDLAEALERCGPAAPAKKKPARPRASPRPHRGRP
jgi:D-alanine-D-alanine ligase-like ATP-grasp enzyme